MPRNIFGLVCGFSAVEHPGSESRAIHNQPAKSPFRWAQSSFRATQSSRNFTRRNSSVSDFYLFEDAHERDAPNAANDLQPTVHGPLCWGNSFEKLLDDVSGLHAFAEFLKKEFSAENIYFWAACERYRQLPDPERPAEAKSIFDLHLAIGCLEPVNVDSQARSTAQDNLPDASSDLFAQTQKQIFNLMKFDSYQRFIRSDLYKACLDAEQKGLPLPYPGDQLDPALRTVQQTAANGSSKLKKSLSNAEDRRRKSLLPWHRKQRCKSKDRQQEGDGAASNGAEHTISSMGANVRSMLMFSSTSSIPKALASSGGTGMPLNAPSDLTSSRSSLSSFDTALSQLHGQHQHADGSDAGECRTCLCRVLLTGGATTIVQTRPNESIRELIERLLEKRGIVYRAFEAFLAGSNKPLNLDEPSSSVAGKEVTVDQRIAFRLDLPNRKVISVKSKTTKALEDVLRPILHKYNYRLDLVHVLPRDRSAGPLDKSISVQEIDGQRFQVVLKSSEMLDEEDANSPSAAAVPYHPFRHHASSSAAASGRNSPPAYLPPPVPYDLQPHASADHSGMAPNGGQSQRWPSNMSQSHLDEITNSVFNELLQEKVGAQAHPNHTGGLNAVSANGVSLAAHAAASGHGTSTGSATAAADAQSSRSADWDTESGSSLFDRLRRNNAKKMEFLGRPANGDADGGSSASDKRPLMSKWKLPVTHKSENHDLLEGLKRAQRSRLEDQRGTEINYELPDFLKNKENFNKTKLRKVKPDDPVPLARSKFDEPECTVPLTNGSNSVPTTPTSPAFPQPAPRPSITKLSPTKANDAQPVPMRRHSAGLPDAADTSTECPSVTFGSSQADSSFLSGQMSALSNATMTSTISIGSAGTAAGSSFQQHSADADDRNNNSAMEAVAQPSPDVGRRGNGAPPPLPPKPKVLPIKPSNWAGSLSANTSSTSATSLLSSGTHNGSIGSLPSPVKDELPPNVYLDQPSSSFV